MIDLPTTDDEAPSEAPSEAPDEILDDAPAEDPTPVKRRVWRLVALITGLSLLVSAGGVALAGWLYFRSVDGDIERVDAFAGMPEEERPAKAVEKAMNLLVLGTDSTDPEEPVARADTIILVHVPAATDKAQLISIPRDTWVRIPKARDGAKINAALAMGGVPLMVQTVEAFTGVRVDHVVLFDFAGFTEIVDALGGVDVKVETSFTSIHPPYRKFLAGTRHMDGATALDFARQRKQFANGDFTRIRNQQEVIRAVLRQSTEILADPFRLNAFLQASAEAVSVDKGLGLFDLAMRLRNLRPADLNFMTSPSRGTGTMGSESVVLPNVDAAAALFRAVRTDTMDEYLRE